MRLFLFIASLLSATEQLWAKEICCQGLPCYSNDPPFAHLPVPECPKDIDIKMTVFTRQDPIIGQTITRDTIPSSFKDNVLTMFVVHGWNPVIPSIQWMYTIKDTALKKGDFNVIVVTWRGAMLQLFADQTASNTRPVGGEIALVSNNTISKGKSSKALMYCVGHSFGAHACGQAGQQGQFGRITGLDPASPFFQDYDLSVGLNPSCADLVDNIHTNTQPLLGMALGSLRPIGHIDFYPNGGGTQPGCTITQGLLPVLTCNNQLEVCVDVDIACSHMRATGFFEESIRTPCFLSYSSCSDQTKIPDSCTESKDPVQSMGFNANEYPGRGIFYLQTRACAPYCCTQA